MGGLISNAGGQRRGETRAGFSEEEMVGPLPVRAVLDFGLTFAGRGPGAAGTAGAWLTAAVRGGVEGWETARVCGLTVVC